MAEVGVEMRIECTGREREARRHRQAGTSEARKLRGLLADVADIEHFRRNRSLVGSRQRKTQGRSSSTEHEDRLFRCAARVNRVANLSNTRQP